MKWKMFHVKHPPYQILCKTRGSNILRKIQNIDRDIKKTTKMLHNLLLERTLTIQQLRGLEASSQIQAEQLFRRLRDIEDCGK
jgi:hypothetical protein